MKRSTQTIISLRNHVASLLVLVVISKVQGDRAVFYDKANFQGNTFTLSINGGCYNLKSKWMGKISSVQVDQDSCMIAWNNEGCTGRSMKLLPNSRETINMRIVGFDKQIKSTSLCTEISFRPRPPTDNVGFRIWNPTRQELSRAKNENDNIESPESFEGLREPVELNFYDEPNFTGRIFTLTSNGGCYNFKPKWANQISSLDSAGHCIMIWSGQNCAGDSAILDRPAASEKSRNLNLIGFHKRIQSVRLCSASIHAKNDGEKGEDSKDSSERDLITRKSPQRSMNGDGSLDDNESLKTTGADEDVREIALAEHNELRRLHGVPELQWDSKMQQIAQAHAEWLAKNNKFEHSKNDDLGENLGGISTSNKIHALKESIRLWYDEIKKYDFDNPSISVVGIKAGHFTQLVWKSTTHIGLGIAWNRRRQWYVVVCNYSPPGNYKGNYEKNVFPPIQKEK